MNKVITNVSKLKFDDDIWILTEINELQHEVSENIRIDFNYIKSKEIKLTVKLYAQYKLENAKVKTVKNKINKHLRAFIKYTELKCINSFSSVTKNVFLDFVEWIKTSYKNVNKEYSNLSVYNKCLVVEEIIKIGEVKGWNVPKENIFTDISSAKLFKFQKSTIPRIRAIPEDIYNKIIFCAVNYEKDIATKSAIIIQSETGLGIGEVLSITTKNIKENSDGIIYLEFIDSSKNSRYKILCNRLITDVIYELINSTEELRKESGLEELFIFRNKKNGSINIYNSDRWYKKLSSFVKKWNITDGNGNLYPLQSQQFKMTFIRNLMKRKKSMVPILENYRHVSLERAGQYLKLNKDELRKEYSYMILSPESKIVGIKAKELKEKVKNLASRSKKDHERLIENISSIIKFSYLPTGVCIFDHRTGNCEIEDDSFCYRCQYYITESRFYPILKNELKSIEIKMKRYRELNYERDYQRLYVKWLNLKPVVDELQQEIEKNKKSI